MILVIIVMLIVFELLYLNNNSEALYLFRAALKSMLKWFLM